MELKIYSKEGNLKLTASPDSNSAATCGIQEESVLSLSFTAFECVTLEVYDYADFLGRRYWILERYQPKMNCDSEWSYSVQLSGVEGLTTQVLMVNPDDDDNPILTLTAPAREHAALIIANMNRKWGRPNGKSEKWSYRSTSISNIRESTPPMLFRNCRLPPGRSGGSTG